MRISVIITLLLSLSILNSCQKKFEDPNNISSTSIAAEFKAKINGLQFTGVLTGAAIRDDSVISIAAESDDRQMIVFTVKDSGIHVYTLAFNSLSNFAGYTDARSIAFASNEGINPEDSGGILAITSLDRTKKLISGTFNFKAFHEDNRTQRTITDGVFNNISY
ncbi:MAG TPA: DUF6252 family protein [Ginsengibacter sp.]|nr:DUF6252 family protein [Ginsengibacter sp.]